MQTLSGLISHAMRSDDEVEKLAVWSKGIPISGRDPDEWRMDEFGNTMRYLEHGQLTEYGWEKDHRVAAAIGGMDSLENKRPLHWRANRSLGGTLSALLDRQSK